LACKNNVVTHIVSVGLLAYPNSMKVAYPVFFIVRFVYGPTALFNITQTTQFTERNLLKINWDMWFRLQIISGKLLFLWRIQRDVIMLLYFYIKYRLLRSDTDKYVICFTVFVIFHKYIFYNLSGCNRVIRCGRTDGPTATTKLVLAFRKCVMCIM
jgi:hypothetical protein